jgi:hypothetical protein
MQPQFGLDAPWLAGLFPGPCSAAQQQRYRREFQLSSFQILCHCNASEFESSQLELRQRASNWLTPARELFWSANGVTTESGIEELSRKNDIRNRLRAELHQAKRAQSFSVENDLVSYTAPCTGI